MKRKAYESYPKVSYRSKETILSVTNYLFDKNSLFTIQALPDDWNKLSDYLYEQSDYEQWDSFTGTIFSAFVVPSWPHIKKEHFTRKKFVNAMKLQASLLYYFFAYVCKKYNNKLPPQLNSLEIDQQMMEEMATGQEDSYASIVYTAYCMQRRYDNYLKQGIYFSPFGVPISERADRLFDAVKEDAYYPFLNPNDHAFKNRAAEMLNRLLECPDFLEKVLQKKGNIFSIKEKSGDQDTRKLSKLEKLVQATNNYRDKNFEELTLGERLNIISLNRLVLQKTYPQISPKENSMHLEPFFSDYLSVGLNNFYMTYILDGRKLLEKEKDCKDILEFLMEISSPPSMRSVVNPNLSGLIYDVNKYFEIFWKEVTEEEKNFDLRKFIPSLQQYLMQNILKD